MFKNLFSSVIILFSLVLASVSSAAPQGNKYEEREAVFSAWKKDLGHLASTSGVSLLKDVSSYLESVTLLVPEKDGTATPMNARPADSVNVLVLLPSDRTNKVWDRFYSQEHVAANFLPENNTIVIRAENISPRVRGMILGHEGMHALAFGAERKVEQTDTEYCNEEALAHRLEFDTFSAIDPKFVSAVDTEAKKLAESMKKNRGNVSFNGELSDATLDSVFGKSESELGTQYRATLFANSIFISAMFRYYAGNEDRAMTRFSSYLCGRYKQFGIR